MTNPVKHCLRRLDHASAISDTTATTLVSDALNELEAAYTHPTDRILALETVLHGYRDLQTGRHVAPFQRVLTSSVDQRQTLLSRSGPRPVRREH